MLDAYQIRLLRKISTSDIPTHRVYARVGHAVAKNMLDAWLEFWEQAPENVLNLKW